MPSNLALVIPDRDAQMRLEAEAAEFANRPRLVRVPPTEAQKGWIPIAERPEELINYPADVRWMVKAYGIEG